MRKDYEMIVAIIPARGGSKGIPGKNMIDFCGRPLLEWTVRQAQGSRLIDEVVVSSDSTEIREFAWKNLGTRIHHRTKEASTDTASMEMVVDEVIQSANLSNKRAVIVALQCTSPLRTSQHIDEALMQFAFGRYDSMFSACELDDFCVWQGGDDPKSINFDYKRRVRRQLREPSYLENGSFFLFTPRSFYEYRNRIGGKIGMYLQPWWCQWEIDAPKDLEICEYFFKRYVL